MRRVGLLLNKVVFFSLLALIVLVSLPYGTVDAWSEALFEVAVFAITAIWIFEILLGDKVEVRKLLILLPLVLLTAYAFGQIVVWPAGLSSGMGRLTAQHTLSIDRYQTYLTARKMLALTLFLGLLLLHTSTSKRFRWLVRVVIGLGLGSAFFGILRQLLQSPDSPAGFVLPFLYYGIGYGQFIYHNLFAYLMEMTFGLMAGLVLAGGVRRDRILIYLSGGLVVLAALVLSLSRGGFISLACQSIFLVFMSLSWYSARRLARENGTRLKQLRFIQSSLLIRIPIIVLIVSVLIAAMFWMGGEKFISRLGEGISNVESVDNLTRTAAWRSSWELIKRQPWTGVGFGNYFLAITEFQTGAGRFKLEQAHNDYLDLAANGGVIGVILAGWFIGWIIWRARSSLQSSDAYRRAAGLGAVAGILSVGVHSLMDFGLQVTGIAVVFAALVVISVADIKAESVSDARRISPRPNRMSQ